MLHRLYRGLCTPRTVLSSHPLHHLEVADPSGQFEMIRLPAVFKHGATVRRVHGLENTEVSGRNGRPYRSTITAVLVKVRFQHVKRVAAFDDRRREIARRFGKRKVVY